jgi:hypothetical protein
MIYRKLSYTGKRDSLKMFLRLLINYYGGGAKVWAVANAEKRGIEYD